MTAYNTSHGIHKVMIGFDLRLANGDFLFYPLYLNLETGEFTDFLASFEQTSLFDVLSDEIIGVEFSDEAHFLARRCDERYYYFDLVKNQVWDLEELSGSSLQGYTLLSDQLVCWDDTGYFWSIRLSDGAVTPLIQVSTVTFASRGYPFALYRDQALYLLDFRTGESCRLQEPEGYIIPGNQYVLSHDGSMFFMFNYKPPMDTPMDTPSILILDMNQYVFHEMTIELPDEPVQGWTTTEQNELVLVNYSFTDYYFYDLCNLSP